MKSNDKLSEIRKMLPFGAISEIAKNSNVKYQTVSRVLNGKSKNFKVMMALAEYVIKLKEVNKAVYSAFEDYCNNEVAA